MTIALIGYFLYSKDYINYFIFIMEKFKWQTTVKDK